MLSRALVNIEAAAYDTPVRAAALARPLNEYFLSNLSTAESNTFPRVVFLEFPDAALITAVPICAAYGLYVFKNGSFLNNYLAGYTGITLDDMYDAGSDYMGLVNRLDLLVSLSPKLFQSSKLGP